MYKHHEFLPEGFPRMRGDEPIRENRLGDKKTFSPYARG